MTEDQIERKVERATDYVDHQLMTGVYTQAVYNQKMREINAWAEGQYRANERAAENSWQRLEIATLHAMHNLGHR